MPDLLGSEPKCVPEQFVDVHGITMDQKIGRRKRFRILVSIDVDTENLRRTRRLTVLGGCQNADDFVPGTRVQIQEQIETLLADPRKEHTLCGHRLHSPTLLMRLCRRCSPRPPREVGALHDVRHGCVHHAPMVPPETPVAAMHVTRATAQGPLDHVARREKRCEAESGRRRTEERHDRRSDSFGYMHGAGIAGDEHGQPREVRRKNSERARYDAAPPILPEPLLEPSCEGVLRRPDEKRHAATRILVHLACRLEEALSWPALVRPSASRCDADPLGVRSKRLERPRPRVV